MSATVLFMNISFGGPDGKVIGESTAKDYETRIEIESFSWSIRTKDRDETPKGSTTKVTKSVLIPETVEIEKFYDSSSHSLMSHMNQRKKFKTAVISYAYPALIEGQRFTEVMALTLRDGYIESVKVQTSGAGKAMAAKETVVLSFDKLVLRYHPPVLKRDTRGAASSFTYEQQGATFND